MKPDIYVSDTGRAWSADENPELANTHKGYYTADQLRTAQGKVLREAAATVLARYFAHDAANYLRRMADELEKQ